MRLLPAQSLQSGDPGRIVRFETHISDAKTANLGSLVAKQWPEGVGIRELEPPKCGPRGGDPDEAALPHPGGLETDPEGCPRSPPPGATSLYTWRMRRDVNTRGEIGRMHE